MEAILNSNDFYLFCLSFGGFYMLILLSDRTFGRRGSLLPLWSIWLVRFFVIEILIGEIWTKQFGSALWFQRFHTLMYSTMIGIMLAVYVRTFYGGFKLLLLMTFVDFIFPCYIWLIQHITKYVLGIFFSFGDKAYLIPLLGVIVSWILYWRILILLEPFLEKYRNYEIKHMWLARIYFGFYLLLCVCGNEMYIFRLTNNKNLHSYAIIFPCIVGAFFYVVILIGAALAYDHRLRKEHDTLVENEMRMEEYLHLVESQADLAQSYKKEMGKLSAQFFYDMKENLKGDDVKAYLQRVREQYESMTATLYCDEFSVDALLSSFASLCREKGIKTDFLFYGYERGQIEEKDMLSLLMHVLDIGLETKPQKIQLHVTAIKNQLVLLMRAETENQTETKNQPETENQAGDGNQLETENQTETKNQPEDRNQLKNKSGTRNKTKHIGKTDATAKTSVGSAYFSGTSRSIRKKKRVFHRYIKKYAGVLEIEETDGKVQIMISLCR